MYSFGPISSPLDTTLTIGETIWRNAPEKSAEPWCGTLNTSDRRLMLAPLCSRGEDAAGLVVQVAARTGS